MESGVRFQSALPGYHKELTLGQCLLMAERERRLREAQTTMNPVMDPDLLAEWECWDQASLRVEIY